MWVALSKVTSKNDCAFQDFEKCGWLGSEQAAVRKRVTTSGSERIPCKNPGKVEIRKIGNTQSPSYQRTKLS